MAKVNIKFNKARLQADLVKRIEKAMDAEPLKQEIGIFATDRIRFEARRGQPLNSERSFPKLKSLTVENREYLEKFNKTHRVFSPSRSNVSLTGQFLNSLGFQRIRFGVELLFLGSRKPYRTGPNSVEKNPPTNAELAGHLSALGFKVFTKKGIESDRKFQNNIVRIVRKFLRSSLK